MDYTLRGDPRRQPELAADVGLNFGRCTLMGEANPTDAPADDETATYQVWDGKRLLHHFFRHGNPTPSPSVIARTKLHQEIGGYNAKLPHTSAKAKEHDGTVATFTGVALVDVLKVAGVEFGESMRGKRLATYLLVEAADGYRAVFALAEIDPSMTDQFVLVADRRNGKPLDETFGPYRLIVPHDKLHSRWVRQVVQISLQHPPPARKQPGAKP